MDEETTLMEIPFELCFIVGLIVFVGFLLLIYFMNQKKFLVILPHDNPIILLEKMDFLFRSHGLQTKMNSQAQVIKVSKSTIVAADIFIKEDQNGNIEAVSGSTTTDIGWYIVIGLLFLTSGIGFLIFIIIIHVLSRNFAKDEIKPLLENHTF
jgi:hypothetical protein